MNGWARWALRRAHRVSKARGQETLVQNVKVEERHDQRVPLDRETTLRRHHYLQHHAHGWNHPSLEQRPMVTGMK